MKNKHFNYISCFLVILCSVSLLHGCSRLGEEEMKRLEEDAVNVTEEPLTLSEDDNIYYKMGETFQKKDWDYDNQKNIIWKEAVYEYTINSAKAYENPVKAGLKKEKLTESECNIGLIPNEFGSADLDTVMESKILICDILIKNISSDYNNITDISLGYEKENHEVVSVGYPEYFSHAENMSGGYWRYRLLKGETVDVQVGWLIDEKVLGEEKPLDLSRFYIVTNISGDRRCQNIVKLQVENLME